MDGGDTASTWSLCRRRFLGSTLKPSSGRPATRMNMSINAAGRRWSLRNCSRRAATSAEVSEKNCSRSNSLREAARPPCRRSEGRRRAWQWAAAGGRSMYRRGCRQCSREISRRGWQRLRSLVVTGSQAKVHQSARKGRCTGNSDISKCLFLKRLFWQSAPICTERTITPCAPSGGLLVRTRINAADHGADLLRHKDRRGACGAWCCGVLRMARGTKRKVSGSHAFNPTRCRLTSRALRPNRKGKLTAGSGRVQQVLNTSGLECCPPKRAHV